MSIYLGSTFATYNYYTKNSAAALQQEAATPEVSRATAYYEANIGSVKTVDDFVNNYQLFNYAMTAYGLSDMAYAKAYMKEVLNSDLSSTSSFANQLADTKFATFAKAFSNLNPNASSSSYTPATTQEVVNNYVQQSLQTSVGQDDQGVQLALYFKENAANITSTYQVLGDAAIWQVVQTVYGFPASMGSMDIATQKAEVDAKFNVADLQDPTKVDQLLNRFTAVWDATQNSSSDPILALFDGGSVSGSNPDLQLFDTTSSSVSSDVSASLLNLPYGG
ncbi:DUF1217 domain-containing protein [Azorhizobium doebereinerae]|uniref:DUF1217 domain-containing protein n=1 Tax=Azorhizobium doebereinerae TaxID=281091 RepID=UPI000416D91D|nr:DUF1217 domain-containing protein [Azorhizobium doebereinerae]